MPIGTTSSSIILSRVMRYGMPAISVALRWPNDWLLSALSGRSAATATAATCVYPGNYDPSIRSTLFANPPQLFITGHSHILRVKYDKTLGLLHINPGAAGQQGWQKDRTLVRLTIDGKTFKDLEVISLGDK